MVGVSVGVGVGVDVIIGVKVTVGAKVGVDVGGSEGVAGVQAERIMDNINMPVRNNPGRIVTPPGVFIIHYPPMYPMAQVISSPIL